MILQLNKVSKSFGTDEILNDITFSVNENDRIGIIGRNGCGKTTLLNIISGSMPYSGGTCTAPKDVRIGFLRQTGCETMNTTIMEEMTSVFKSVFETEEDMRRLEKEISKEIDDKKRSALLNQYAKKSEMFEKADGFLIKTKINTILTGMGFDKFDLNMKADKLSGGEKTKLSFAKLLLEEREILLLDEPTNHLDLNSKEVLEAALNDFGGTVIFISHDRYLLNKVPDKIVEITQDGAVVYDGNYEYYKERSQQQAKAAEQPKETKKKTDGGYRSREMRRADAMRKQQIKQIEDEISYLEQTCKTLEEELSCEEVYSSFELTREKSLELESANKRLEECFEEWEKLSEE